ncbi:MAG: glycoside hydrolase family 3 N-terminal domain-containing protein [Oscillospiraceae bacterium]|nr:glycoside hydrolase family 3 N-terminal domain-containing protein [Oscillospiraceae bacterium]
MKKRILGLLLCFVILTGLLPTMAAGYDAANAVQSSQAWVSRGTFLTELAHLAGAAAEDSDAGFSDVDAAAVCAPYLSWAAKNGIVSGYDDGTFRPDAALTRQQAAVLTANYLTFAGYSRGTGERTANVYTDSAEISAWAETSAAMVTRLGIMQGTADGTFSPKAALTQAQSAQILANLTSFLSEDGARNQKAQQLCADMTLDEKIGQVLFVNFRYWKNAGEETASGMEVLSSEVEEVIQKYHLGNIILFSENTKTTAGTARLTADLQSAAKAAGDLPLLIGIDQEGGIVTRLGQGTCMPGNMALGATGNPQYAYQAAQVIGEELAALGVNCNLAPDSDVNDNPENPVIGLRAFGADPLLVSAMARQYLAGLKSTGTIGCAKHFPGHGNTATDTHTGLALVDKTKSEWEAVEAVPFQTLIASGIDMVMTAHIQYPNLDRTQAISKSSGEPIYLPATLSHTILTDILRGQLGFDGVICTDAMEMAAITSNFGETQAVVMALQAGSELLCNPTGLASLNDVSKLEAIYQAIKTSVASGELPQAQLDAAVTRILKLKLKNGIIGKEYSTADAQVQRAAAVVGNAAHRATERTIAEAAVTLYGGSDAPIVMKPGETVLFAVPYENECGSVRFAVNRLAAEDAIPNITLKIACYYKAEQLSDELAAEIREADHVVVLSEQTASTLMNPAHWLYARPQEILSVAAASGKSDSAVVSLGLPYDAPNYAGVPVYLAYGYIGMTEEDAQRGEITGKYGPNIAAGIGCALGAFAPTGKLPVS